MIGWFIVVIVLLIILFKVISSEKSETKTNNNNDVLVKKVPFVKGSLPFIGHGLHLGENLMRFLSNCHSNYGEAFKIKIYRRKFLVICNHTLAQEYFKGSESTLSLRKTSESTNADIGNFKKEETMQRGLDILRKTVVTLTHGNQAKHLILEMVNQIKCYVDNLSNQTQDTQADLDLRSEMYKLVTKTSIWCMIGTECDDQAIAKFRKYNSLLNTFMQMSFVVPKWLFKLIFGWIATKNRNSIAQHFKSHILECRKNPKVAATAPLIQAAFNYRGKEGKLSNEEVAEVIGQFLHASLENNSLLLTNLVTYLALPENAAVLDLLRNECKDIGLNNPCVLATSTPFLNACIWETARLSSQPLTSTRVPVRPALKSFGGWEIDEDIDYIALSGILSAEGRHKEPLCFNPGRFLGENPEPMTPHDITTWGAAPHICPGISFAHFLDKISLAYLVTNFDFKISNELSDYDFIQRNTFRERKVSMKFVKRTN